MADTKQVKYEITADGSGFSQAMQSAATAAQGASSQIKGHFDGVGKAFEVVQKQLLLITAIVGGGAFFKEAIAGSNKLTGEVSTLQKRLAITADDANALNTALGDIGADSDTYIGAFDQFAKQLKKNEEGLIGMGLQTRDANGHLRDSNTLFTEALQTVGEYKPGLDQTTAAMSLFGKSVDDVMKLQKLNNGVLEEAKRKNAELGLTVTKENVEASKRYKAAMNDVGDVLTAVQKTIGDAVMPVFTELAEYFSSAGPYVVDIFKGALTGLLLVFRVLQAGVKAVSGVIFELINGLMDQLGNLSELLSAVFRGDFDAAAKAWERIGDRFTQSVRNVVQSTAGAFGDARDAFSNDLNRTWGPGTAMSGPKGGTKQMGDFKADKDARMSGWEADLEEQKQAIAERAHLEGTFRQMSIQEEAAYWQQLLQRTDLSEKERTALRKKAATANLQIDKEAFEEQIAQLAVQRDEAQKNFTQRIELAERAYAITSSKYGDESKEARKAYGEVLAERRKLAEQVQQLQALEADATRRQAESAVELERISTEQQLQTGAITKQQQLQMEQGYEERLYAIKLAGLRERLALVLKEKDPEAWAQANDRIAQLELQHQARMASIQSQSAVDSSRPILDTFRSIQSSWANLLQNLMSGTLTIGGFIRGLFTSVAQAVISTLSQIVAKWAIDLILQKVMSKTTAISQISANAGVAGSAATASAAAIPVYGWAIAPEAGASAFAAAMSYMPAASAAGGFDIPAGVNPVTQLHEKEMVLPAKHADVIRQMAESNGVQAPAPAPPELKGFTAGEFFIAHKRQLFEVLAMGRRDFAIRK